VSLARPSSYEWDIIKFQFEKEAGIYSCDDAAVISFNKTLIGKRGTESFWSLATPSVPVGGSKDGTAANSLQFMKFWETVKNDGRYAHFDWTVKLDPDAVLLPDRLRRHIFKLGSGKKYIRDCNKPGMQGTMMFGAMEVISKSALESYNANVGRCFNELPWKSWGEDLFMMTCLERLGVGYSEDFALVQDGVCRGVWCGDKWAAAFHAMKSVSAWKGCWKEAVGAR
jgi:hypothetical protein